VLADTCQAFTLGDAVTAPNVTVVGSSLRGESSYAHHSDDVLGLSVIERYTHALMEFLKGKSLEELTLQQGLVDPYPFASQRAHVGAKDETSALKMNEMRMSDFFANQAVPKKAAAKEVPVRIIPPDEPVLFTQVFPAAEGSLNPPLKDLNLFHDGSPTMIADWKDRGTADLDVTTPEHRRSPRKEGVEPTDSVFLALTTVLIGSVVWSSFAAANRKR
jgi:hypothetical protein